MVAWLRAHGHPDARRYLAGDGKQPGDVDAIPGVTLEVKDQNDYDISGWLRQAVAESRGRIAVVVMHPRGVADVGDWWAVMRVSDLNRLVLDDDELGQAS